MLASSRSLVQRTVVLSIIAVILTLVAILVGTDNSLLLTLRSVRTLLAFSVGASLTLCGILLQTLLRNPLAEPYTLGIAGGASLGAAFTLFIPFVPTPVAALVGALVVAGLILKLARKTTPTELLLVGLMISFLTSAVVSLLMGTVSPEKLSALMHWMLGGVEGKTWIDFALLTTLLIVVLFITYFKSHALNALLLGEETATSLGVDVPRVQKLLYLSAALLTAVVVSIAGLIGFVGLLVPHLTRILFGTDHRQLLITAPLIGGIALVFTDGILRWAWAPLELPLGAITAIVGAPLFLYLLLRKRVAA